jgi:H+-transporting ATPase
LNFKPDTTSELGLTSAEARERLARIGSNAIAEKPGRPARIYLAKFWGPIPWMLEAAIVLQVTTGKHVEAAVVAALLLFNATLSYFQERRAGAALAALRKRLAPVATVRRDGRWTSRPAAELVPGDVISLSLGAVVPADVRVLSGAVTVDQSTLTGESVPAEAGPGSQAFAGALVRHGRAAAEVTATGSKTYFGRTAELVQEARGPSTEQRAILSVTKNLAIVNGSVAALIVAYAFFIGLHPDELVRLALTALLATIPLALPATFTLSAAVGAQALARRGVLLTRLSAAHEAAAMDLLCADKTGTLTRNELRVVEVVAFAGLTRERVLALAAFASAETDEDPIDRAINTAAKALAQDGHERRVRFEPFDPATKLSRALAQDAEGNGIEVIKGAFEALSAIAPIPPGAEHSMAGLAAQGHRIIAVAAGDLRALRVVGLVAISDSPRKDSAALISTLREMNVRTVMLTGDSPLTGAAVAAKVGIVGDVCLANEGAAGRDAQRCGVFARILPEQKYRLVRAFQDTGHVVGMCGDGVNDAPALRQAQFGIAVSTATDVAKAAAGAVLTEPGLGGVVHAVREGRIAFQRLLAYTFNMLVKKTEIVLFLALGFLLTAHPILTPTLMVLLFVTNDFLSMSLTTDRASPAATPSVWRMASITRAAVVLGACKLVFSLTIISVGKLRLGLDGDALQTLAFVTLVCGNQAVLYVLRERQRLWGSRPSNWVLASSAFDIAFAFALAGSGSLMQPLAWQVLLSILAAAAGFALVLDQVKRPVLSFFKL